MATSKAVDDRPDPDALLNAAIAEGRGKLKVFLGAAPGVGKTFAMLSAAQQLARDGGNVLIGVVETHGRADTQALLEGLEILPRKTIEYRGHTFEEFDLDASLARRPALIVVDELAHTNAPESRHPKRYQDVEELLRAGIDVWTAVNIQHLESLSDVVSKITGVQIRETVPDTVIEKASEVVVVDITPSELLQRLKEGKVYLPENARRAADNFFKMGNLTALRELALRRTADRVDDQMFEYLRQNAIQGAWPAAERILACIGPDAGSDRVVRAASRLASGLNASWVAATITSDSNDVTDPVSQRRTDETMRLAERLGADTARLSGQDIAAQLLRFAKRENITQIVIGRSNAGFWARLRRRSLPAALIRQGADMAVHVVIGPNEQPQKARFRLPRMSIAALDTVVALGSVLLAVVAGSVATHFLQLPNVSMIFLTAVLISAVTRGVGAAIGAAFASFLAYNFFFIPPLYTFTIAEPHELFALLIYLLVAVLTGGLAGRVTEQSYAARKRVATIQSLVDIAKKLSATANLEDALYVVAYQSAASVKGQVLVLLPKDGGLEIRSAYPPEDELGPAEGAAARWALRNGEIAGRYSSTMPNAAYQFWPMRTSQGVIGVIGIAPRSNEPLSAEDDRAFAAIVDQASGAIERILLAESASQAKASAEREKLKTALLSSISHDLRTPLSSILGAVTSLRCYGSRMPEDTQQDLLAAIEEESRRLARFVSNLLDMTRLEAGELDLCRDWVDLNEVITAAVGRARRTFASRMIELSMPEHVPLTKGDPILLEQVIFNLLDNAEKYVPRGTPTRVSLQEEGPELVIRVEDDGPGIQATDLQHIFEKFYRVHAGDGRPAGTGLGLAIAKGVVEAMGGSISAESPASGDKGARIVIRLPEPEHNPGRPTSERDSHVDAPENTRS
jgi:two-component system sensor histidine kinase KdpD